MYDQGSYVMEIIKSACNTDIFHEQVIMINGADLELI